MMKVVISGGGTGGHLYPALTLAIELKKRNDEVLFIGAKNRIEEKVVPKANIDFISIDVVGYKKTFKGTYEFIKKQYSAIKEIKKILNEFKPNVVIGWGGYASFATLTAANILKIPTIIHEQNAQIGRANYLLALKADKRLVCYKGVIKNEILVGNPRASEAIKHLKTVNKKRKQVLFVMGSQGSSSVNKIIYDYLNLRNNNYEVIIITGKGHLGIFDDAKLEGVTLLEFSNDIMNLINQVDIVVTRGGATTLQELSALAKPSIIIPSPYVYKNHQYYNALYYQKNEAALVLKETKLTPEILKDTVESLINNNFKLENMKKKMLSCAFPNALKDIIRIIDYYDSK